MHPKHHHHFFHCDATRRHCHNPDSLAPTARGLTNSVNFARGEAHRRPCARLMAIDVRAMRPRDIDSLCAVHPTPRATLSTTKAWRGDAPSLAASTTTPRSQAPRLRRALEAARDRASLQRQEQKRKPNDAQHAQRRQGDATQESCD